jgi:predicted cupin superfamily sugar epimerase
MLDLRPLPGEGGLFRETYRSRAFVEGNRSLATAIYYLLTPDHVSLMHRVRGDEVFHFYLGDPVEMLQLRADGNGDVFVLGTDLAAGMRPQLVVPGGVWQGAALRAGGTFALLGTTMSPGFDVADFELGDRAALTSKFAAFTKEIVRLTR